MRKRKSGERFESRIQTWSPDRKPVLEAVGRGEEWKDMLVLTALPWRRGNLKTFLPTRFSQQTSHGRGGWRQRPRPRRPLRGTHLVTSSSTRCKSPAKSANPARLRSETRAAPRACDGAAREARPLGEPVKSGLRHLSSPFASLPSLAGAHTLSKKRTLTTRLLSQAPLATTSDLMQKHLHLFFKSMEEAKLPAWGHQEMADWRWGWSTCCIRPLHACLPSNSSKMGKLGSRTQVPFTAPVSSCLWSVWAPWGQRLCLASRFSPVRSRARYIIRPKACRAMVSIPPIPLWTGASWQKPCLRHLYFRAPCTCMLTLNRREFTRRLST